MFIMSYRVMMGIYILAAVIPAVFLMRYIYKNDTWEKEPIPLLVQLVGLGVVAALLSGTLEHLGESILQLFISPYHPRYVVAMAFIVIAAVEEAMKYALMHHRTWNDPNFNYRFDGIVYAAFVSMGFAAWENIQYVMGYGLSVAFPRAFLAIPAHLGFSVFMGLFYGRAREVANQGNEAGAKTLKAIGYILAVVLHGIYDACAMSGTGRATLLFVAFVALMYLVVFRVIRRESQYNRPI